MSKKITNSILLLSLVISLHSCNQGSEKQTTENNGEITLIKHVMTKEEQDKLTADEVLIEFKEGNQRFNNGTTTIRDHSQQVRKSALGQFPKAVVLSCLDSRVPVEDVFDQGIGDIFVARIAGNFVNEDLLGSIEFACKIAGVKLVVIMGHQHCGAIKGAIDNVQMGNITGMLAKIKPAIAMSDEFTGEKTSKNEVYVQTVSQNNIRHAMSQIRKKSVLLQEMEQKGQIKITGMFYRLTDGKLEFIE